MTSVRVMFVGQGASLLPEDRFVNVFHFHDPTILPYDDAILPLADALENFYTQATTGGNSVSTFISPYVGRAAKLIFYNMGAAEPRVPTEISLTLGAALGSGYAEEVAVCVSLAGAPPVTNRRRGRIYIGPLSNSGSAIVAGTTVIPTRPAAASATNLVQTLAFAANRLITESNTAGYPWCIRSTVPSENYVPVHHGWIDDALDTQRRRGPKPTTRTVFGA